MTDRTLDRRGFVTKGVVAGAVGLGISGALVANRSGTLPVNSKLVGLNDPDLIQRASNIRVKIENVGGEPIRPQFSTIRDGLQTRFYWDVVGDTNVVRPQQSQTFELRATNARMAIPYKNKFILLMENSGGDMGETSSYTNDAPPGLLPVRNPQFGNWVTKTGDTTPFPFRWDLASEERSNDGVEISESEAGVKMYAERGRSGGPWTMAGLSQRVPSLSKVSVTARSETLTELSKVQSGPVCGLEIIDRNHRIWLVFADADEQRLEYIDGELDYHVEYLPATPGSVTDATVDLARIYDERGWSRPRTEQYRIDGVAYDASTLILHPFAAVYGDGGRAEVEFHRVDGSR